MHLTRFTDYGLRCLMYLAARPQELSSVKMISDHYGISRNHLVKVVHRLSQLGYIETTKGKGGGIRIASGTADLKLGNLIQSLEPNMSTVECFDANTNTCNISDQCQLKHLLYDATRAFIDKLDEYTLADTVSNADDVFPIHIK